MYKTSPLFQTAAQTLALLCLVAPPAIAHNVEVAGDVAGTWHVEPDHNPRAGEPARVWVALTRKGGEVLPLAEATCKLAVFPQPHQDGSAPILQPELKAIAVEKFEGIPGADVVFPAPGLYEMELSCAPKTEGSFAAFEMQSEVTVIAGVAQSPPVENLVGSAPGVDEPEAGVNWVGLGGLVGAIALGLGIWGVLKGRSGK